MRFTEQDRREARSILDLAWPLIIAQGGLQLMVVVDTLIIGRTTALEMSAVALGSALIGFIAVFGIGVAMGVEPLVGQAFGAQEHETARRWMHQGLWVGALISIPVIILSAATTLALESLGVSAELAARTEDFVYTRLPGIPFLICAVVLRSYLANVGRARPAMISVLIGNVVNVAMDWVLVFGLYGFPAMGALGVGWTTTVATAVIFAVLLAFVMLIDRDGPRPKVERPKMSMQRQIFRMGSPIGAQLSVETGVFALVSTLIGRLGEVSLAGHLVALSLSSQVFNAGIGLSSATSARVGFHVGARDHRMARRAGFMGIWIGCAMGVAAALVFMLAPGFLAMLFGAEPAVAAVAEKLIVIAGLFALSDVVQVLGAGALRGAGDTKWPFGANLVAHYAVGLPIGLGSQYFFDAGANGYWWGLAIGLTGVAIVLPLRFNRLSKRPIRRVQSVVE